MIYCKHARMEGDKHLTVGVDDWNALALLWNAQSHSQTTPAREAVRRITFQLVTLKAELGQLGMFKTMLALDEATRAIGWEAAERFDHDDLLRRQVHPKALALRALANQEPQA